MYASLSSRALALLDDALDQPEDDRVRWIDAHCGDDVALAGEAHLLLNAVSSPAGILDVSPGPPFAPDMSQSITRALHDHYEVLHEIGRGGMATVFLARERKHDRDVVVKVLNPLLARFCGAERFQREVFIAATLSHPHIVPLIDSGEAGGFLYYVMPSMDGRSLRAELKDERPTLPDALRILKDIAGALEFAHASGVVHRDLKPENVLMASGHAYLLDFGIAKLASDATDASDITAPGLALGTRRYMAPEQIYAAGAVDARADIYAWGILGAELLTGGPLPDGEPRDVARCELEQRADVPRAVITLLLDCLATSPADRPADMFDVLRRLTSPRTPFRTRVHRRRAQMVLSAGLGAALVAAAALAFGVTQRLPATTLTEPVAVSVLRNETGDTAMAVLGRFAGDWITDGLQRLGVVKVVPWSEALLASEHAAATGASLVSTLHDETFAGTVVTGSYYRLRDSLHLQAQLVDAQSGELVSLLAPIVVPIANPESGLAQLRDRVMGAVAASRDERIASLPGITRNSPSFAAYEAFDRGLDSFLAQRYSAALQQFRTAFDLDTTFTAAALWAARAALNLDSISTTRAAREQLMRMNPDRGEMRDWSSYWTQRAHVAYLLGNHIEELSAAREMQTRYPERAVSWLKARLAAVPDDRAHRYWLGSVLYDLERYNAARPYFESLARKFPDKPEYRGLAALVAARRGDRSGSRRWLGPVAPHEISEHMVFCARVAAINRKTENAITYLTSAADHGIEHYPWLADAAFRDFAAVERDPRGQALLSGQ